MTDSTPSFTLDATWLMTDPGTLPAIANQQLTLRDGRIAQISPSTGSAADNSTGRRLVLPALANAHDHARTFRTATLGAFGKPLESWLPYLGLTPAVDPYLCAATSFARSVRQGVVNLMVHYTRVQGLASYVDEAEAVMRAARDVGVRIGFAVAMRDRQGIAYCDDDTVLAQLRPAIRDEVRRRLSAPATSPADQLARVDEVADMIEQRGYTAHANVQYGPAAVHWCSLPLLEAVARASADTGRGVHMHLLETPYQRQWADQHYPDGIVRHLDEIGLLSPRLTLAHCAWARPDELGLLAERGVTIAVNTSSNLGLKSGIAPVPEMLRLGCRVAMGLDGMAFDEDDDALREMRLAWSLHRGWGFDQTMSPAQLWTFAARNGRRSVNAGYRADSEFDDGALLRAGAPADLLVLNWDALDDEALFADIDPLHLLLTRANGRFIDQVFIDGRQVVDQGRLTSVDEAALRAELLARSRAALAADTGVSEWRATLDAYAEDLGPFYRKTLFGCC